MMQIAYERDLKQVYINFVIVGLHEFQCMDINTVVIATLLAGYVMWILRLLFNYWKF